MLRFAMLSSITFLKLNLFNEPRITKPRCKIMIITRSNSVRQGVRLKVVVSCHWGTPVVLLWVFYYQNTRPIISHPIINLLITDNNYGIFLVLDT